MKNNEVINKLDVQFNEIIDFDSDVESNVQLPAIEVEELTSDNIFDDEQLFGKREDKVDQSSKKVNNESKTLFKKEDKVETTTFKRNNNVATIATYTTNIIAKPDFEIIVDENDCAIKIKFSYDEDMLSVFKNNFNNIKFDRDTKYNIIPFNKLNVSRVQKFIDECYDVFGDLQSIYNFKFNIIKKEVKEEKRFNLNDMLSNKNSVAGDVVKTGEYIPSNQSNDDDSSDEEFFGKKQSIYDQKETYSETAEEVAYNMLKDTILINSIGRSVFAYDEKMGCYHFDEDDGIKTQILRKLKSKGLSSYTTNSKLKSISDSIKNYAVADNRFSSFDNKFVAVKLKNSTTIDKATLFISYKNNGERAFRVINSSSKIECNLFADVELDANLIKDENGQEWCGEDLDENKFYYNLNVNKEAPIYTLFINTLFESENFAKIAQMYFGSIFTSEIVFKALFLCGEGNDGKSVLLDMLKSVFKHSTVSFKLNKEDDFQYEILKNKKLAFVSEIKETGFDEMMFKNITGGDEVRINGKHIKRFELDTKNMYVAVAMNYEDMFRIKNLDDAMRRRFVFAKCVTSPRIISNFASKMMNGFFFEDGNYEVESQKLEFTHWLMQGALDALSMRAFQDKTITSEKYGQDAAEFYDMMLAKMMPKGEFFQEFDFEVLDNYEAIPVADLYNYYDNWCFENKHTNKMGSTTFKKELVQFINKKFDVKLDNSDMRVYVQNAKKRALPINILGSGLKTYKLNYNKCLVDCKVISEDKYKKDHAVPNIKYEVETDPSKVFM